MQQCLQTSAPHPNSITHPSARTTSLLAGSRVVERLLALGHTVHAVVAPHEFNNPALTAHLRALPHKDGQLLLFQGDVTHPGSCDAALQAGATCLLHLAAMVKIATDTKEQDNMMRVAMEGTRNVLGGYGQSNIY
jgi:nucleoside-diphosphate-sugar epimerase